MTYKATLGRSATVITAVVTLLLGSLLAYCVYRMVIATAVPVFMIFAFMAIAISSLYVLTWCSAQYFRYPSVRSACAYTHPSLS